MSPFSSGAKNIQPYPTGLLHEAVHDHQEVLDARALCSCVMAGDLSVHMGTQVGSEEVIDDTEGKPIDMIHKNVTQVDYTTFPKQKFLLTQM